MQDEANKGKLQVDGELMAGDTPLEEQGQTQGASKKSKGPDPQQKTAGEIMAALAKAKQAEAGLKEKDGNMGGASSSTQGSNDLPTATDMAASQANEGQHQG